MFDPVSGEGVCGEGVCGEGGIPVTYSPLRHKYFEDVTFVGVINFCASPFGRCRDSEVRFSGGRAEC